jgi:hypothetical protein
MNSEKYIGLDVNQATIVVAVTDSSGKLIMEAILETEAATILQFFAGELWRWPLRKEPGRPEEIAAPPPKRLSGRRLCLVRC